MATVKPSALSAAARLRKRVAATVSPAAAGPGWRALSEHLTALCDERSARKDLNVLVAPGATKIAGDDNPPPGYYMSVAARIALDGNLLPVAPEKIDTDDPEHFASLAALHGVWVHELGHADHTDSMREALDKGPHARQAVLLEEIRMEARANEDRAGNNRWLRAASKRLILAEMKELESKAHAAHAAVLTEGRVVAGSLRVEDVEKVSAQLSAIFEPAELDELRSILSDTVEVADGDVDGMREVARRLAELLPSEGGEGGGTCDGNCQPGEGGEGEPSGVCTCGGCLTEEQKQALSEAVQEAAEKAEAEGAEDLAAGPEGDDLEDLAEKIAKDPEVKETGDDGDGDGDPSPSSEDAPPAHGRGRGRAISVSGVRAATTFERVQRAKLAAILRRVRFRDREKVKVASALPPGRVRMREAMRGSAERSMGRMSTAKPFRKTRRLQVEQPKLRVAVLCDASGSMSGVIADVASAMWVSACAVHDAEGRMIGVAFGDNAEIIIPANKPPTQVSEFPADGGFESIGSAVMIADEQLNLTSDPTGPRLIIIVSDGHWVDSGERALAERELTRLQATGVKVIQVGLDSPPQAHDPDQLVWVDSDQVQNQLADVIGTACEDALSAA